MLAPYAEHTAFDLISAFQPYLQVTVGYPPDKAADWLTLRNRDLVPADEPAPPSMIAAVAADAETAGWTQAEHDEYIRSIHEGRAAQFLAFLEEELRPVIDERYRIRPGRQRALRLLLRRTVLPVRADAAQPDVPPVRRGQPGRAPARTARSSGWRRPSRSAARPSTTCSCT